MEKDIADQAAILAQQRQERQRNGTMKNSSGVGGHAGGYAAPGSNSQFMRRIGAISLVLHLVPVGYMAFQLGLFDMIWTRNVTYAVIGMHVLFAAAGYGAVHFSMPKTREFMVFCVLIVCMCWGAFYFLGGGCEYEKFRGDISRVTPVDRRNFACPYYHDSYGESTAYIDGKYVVVQTREERCKEDPNLEGNVWWNQYPRSPRENAGSTCLGFHKVFSKYEVDDVNKLLTTEALKDISTWREPLPQKVRDLYDSATGDFKKDKEKYHLPNKYPEEPSEDKGKIDLFLWMQTEGIRTQQNEHHKNHKGQPDYKKLVEVDEPGTMQLIEDWLKSPFPTADFLLTSAIIGIASAIVCSAVVGFQA